MGTSVGPPPGTFVPPPWVLGVTPFWSARRFNWHRMLGEHLPRCRQVLYTNAAGYTACRDSARGGPFRSSRRVPRGWGLLGTLLWASSGSLVAPLLGASSATPTLADFVFVCVLACDCRVIWPSVGLRTLCRHEHREDSRTNGGLAHRRSLGQRRPPRPHRPRGLAQVLSRPLH